MNDLQNKVQSKVDKDTLKQKLPMILAAGGGLSLLLLGKLRSSGKVKEELHHHGSLDHVHEHVHVTHNRTDDDKGVGGWEHLTASHSHRHDHASLDHSHRPHRDFDKEHRSEAHIHDHDEPYR